MLLFWGFGFGLLVLLFSGVWSEAGAGYRRVHRECQQLFLLFLGVTRIAQSLVKYPGESPLRFLP